jgi:hypothetical protein
VTGQMEFFLAQFTTEAGEYLPVDDEEPIEAPA